MLVSKPTPGGGAPLGIDLEGGKAKITIPGAVAPGEPEKHEATDSEQETPAAATTEATDESDGN